VYGGTRLFVGVERNPRRGDALSLNRKIFALKLASQNEWGRGGIVCMGCERV
jgi:hypothetical protein